MKQFVITLFIIVPVFLFGRNEKSIPEWYAEQSVPDSSLGRSASLFQFEFRLLDYGGDDHTPTATKLVYSCNGKMDSIGFPANGKMNLKEKPGKYIFQFYVGPYYREVKTDSILIKGGFKTPVHINFKSSVNMVIEAKPVIYVYPEQTQVMNIQLDLNGELGFTYPAYNDGWNFSADRDGTIHMNGKNYPYLFWEGSTDLDDASIDWENGFVVNRDSLVPFFEKNLPLIGLNEKEVTDYITYWVPRMMKNENCYVHFLINEEYDDYATMNITPAPDTKLQLFMIWTSATDVQQASLTPQTFYTTERKGLTVVEWGGTELPFVPAIFNTQASN
ncbi:MAG TPA: hypothetical protein VL651_01875 [Bacteroidia bacterium]|jgi:hypothetical protein|nr:hypothetical protein [Bacteroidia bacterium]